MFNEISKDTYGKFCAPETLEIVLANGTLRWSRPALFNDPFDTVQRFKFTPTFEACKNEILSEFTRIINGRTPRFSVENFWTKMILDLHQKVSSGSISNIQAFNIYKEVCCGFFKKSPDYEDQFFDTVIDSLRTSKILCLTNEYQNLLLWAHYSNSHTGGLLGFQQISDASPWRTAKPVIYQGELPLVLDELDAVKYCTGSFEMSGQQHQETIVERSVFTKGSEWKYEKELRIFSGEGRNRNADFEDISFNSAELSFVVLGCRASEANKARVIELLKVNYPEASVFQALMSKTGYGLDFHEIKN